MYYLLSLLTGALISGMVALNGGLTKQYGMYTATTIIHVVGLFLIALILIWRKEYPFKKRLHWWLYLGGAIGVATTVFNNLAFGKISVSAILALGLFAQSITSLVVDHFGLLGMPKRCFQRLELLGLIVVLAGVVIMIDSTELIAVIVSLFSGVSLVISRSLNAELAKETSISLGTFYNYLIGLLVSILAVLTLGTNEASFAFTKLDFFTQPYIYFGGVIGVVVVWLSNAAVPKISALYFSLFLFVGQIFTGIIVDVLLDHGLLTRNLLGGLLVALGLAVNLRGPVPHTI